MNSKIRIESKYLLSGNNVKLFFISFLSIALRWSAFFGIPFLIYLTFFSDALNSFFETENQYSTLFFKLLLCTVTSIILLLFIVGVKNCENYAFFTASKGKKPKLKKAINYFKPKTLFKALLLYIKILSLKTFWIAYYSFPVGICFAELLYMYSKSTLSYSIFIVLCFSSSLLFSLCLFMYKATVFRYSAAPYYILFNSRTKINYAINKSIEVTDIYIQNALLLKTSLTGWIISCITVFPIVYVLPYCKLCNALLLYNCITRKKEAIPESNYAINYLKLEKNQESI